MVLYFNVHRRAPYWQRAQAVLLPHALALSWIPSGGGRENVVLDLRACREVHSVPSPNHPSSSADAGAMAARRQQLRSLLPYQLIFDDGVERLAVETARDRLKWVAAIWDVLGAAQRSAAPQPRAENTQVALSSRRAEGREDDLGRVASPNRGSTSYSPARRGHSRAAAASTEFSAADRAKGRRTTFEDQSIQTRDEIDRIGSIWKSDLTSDRGESDPQSSLTEALATGPPVPPKDAGPLLRQVEAQSPGFVDQKHVPSLPVSFDERAPTQLSSLGETVADRSMAGTMSVMSFAPADRSLVSEANVDRHQYSSPETDNYESAQSNASDMDEFGPRSPRSEVVFPWMSDHELVPSDSASQRPPRSDWGGTVSSRKSIAVPLAPPPSEPVHDAVVRTPAQEFKESVDSSAQDLVAQPSSRALKTVRAWGVSAATVAPIEQPSKLDTVTEETRSQPMSGLPSGTQIPTGRVAAGVVEDLRTPGIMQDAATPKALSAMSLRTNSSVNSQDVTRLLNYLEQQQEARAARDQYLEEQIQQLQHVIMNLQDKGGSSVRSSSTHRRSSVSTDVKAGAARDAELAAMQEKLDRVLTLVSTAFEGQSRPGSTLRDRPGVHTPAQSPKAQEDLARIENTLQTLLERVQSGGSVVSASRSFHPNILLERPASPPLSDTGDDVRTIEHRTPSVRNGTQRGPGGRDRAILTDMANNALARERHSAPLVVDDISSVYESASSRIPPRSWHSGQAPSPPPNTEFSIPLSASESEIAATRLAPSSWSSREGMPSPPPNTERGEWQRSLGSMPTLSPRTVGDGNTPRELGGVHRPRPRNAGAEASAQSLDMEAEVRRWRSRNKKAGPPGVYAENERGGWYTPRADPQAAPHGNVAESQVSLRCDSFNTYHSRRH